MMVDHVEKMFLTFAMVVLFGVAPVFAQNDVADIESTNHQIGQNDKQQYFLIPPKSKKTPQDGNALLIILPGGDGSADFHPFIKRIFKNAVPDDYAVAQPIAFKWHADQQIVWPTDKLTVDGQKFSSEDFIEAVIADVAKKSKIDKNRVFTMGWSSSGPALYAMALQDKTPIKGSYISMSVYKPNLLPPLENAKDRLFYIEHSKQDRICPYWMASKAVTDLKSNKARVTLVEYDGGHGWRGNVYGRIKSAIDWLDE